LRFEGKQDLLSTTGQIAVLVATRCFAVASFCQFLIPYLLSKDWSVVIAAALDDYAEPLSKTGAVVEPIPFPRGSVSPLRDMKSFLRLVQIFRKYKPYLIHHFHPRPIILGNLAACSVGMAKVAQLRACDIGIMPLPDEPWERGKSALKLIQYLAAGVPAVASPVGANCEVIEDGENGLLAGTDKAWTEKLALLISDPALGMRLAEAGRQAVELRYSVQTNVQHWLEILQRDAG
jgi:glycosyltransferase involved in cell wall biosynthesis